MGTGSGDAVGPTGTQNINGFGDFGGFVAGFSHQIGTTPLSRCLCLSLSLLRAYESGFFFGWASFIGLDTYLLGESAPPGGEYPGIF